MSELTGGVVLDVVVVEVVVVVDESRVTGVELRADVVEVTPSDALASGTARTSARAAETPTTTRAPFRADAATSLFILNCLCSIAETGI